MDETHEVRIKRLEDSVQQLTNRLDNWFNDKESNNNGGQETGEHQRPPQYYRPNTRFYKFEFPRFLRTDVDGWLLECDKYFDLDETPENRKIFMASRQLDEKAYLWHLALMEEVNGRRITWSKYKEALKLRFDHPYKSSTSNITWPESLKTRYSEPVVKGSHAMTTDAHMELQMLEYEEPEYVAVPIMELVDPEQEQKEAFKARENEVHDYVNNQENESCSKITSGFDGLFDCKTGRALQAHSQVMNNEEEMVESINDKGILLQVKECVQRCTWLNFMEFEKSNFLFYNFIVFQEISPTRILILEWFKGELIAMLFGGFCSSSGRVKKNYCAVELKLAMVLRLHANKISLLICRSSS